MGVLGVPMAFSITATPRKLMMTMNRFWSGGNMISVGYNHHLWRLLLLLLFSYDLLTVFKNTLVFKFIFLHSHIQNCVRNPKKNMKKFYKQNFTNEPGPEPALVEN
jgi:hypothetical protein